MRERHNYGVESGNQLTAQTTSQNGQFSGLFRIAERFEKAQPAYDSLGYEKKQWSWFSLSFNCLAAGGG